MAAVEANTESEPSAKCVCLCTAVLSPGTSLGQLARSVTMQSKQPGAALPSCVCSRCSYTVLIWGWFPFCTVSELQPIRIQVSTCQAGIGLKLRRDPSSD